jgi:2-methylcitrate dehydratase PrpD
LPDSPSKTLAAFAANLRFDAIPGQVVSRAQWLFLDWYGSAVAGSQSRSVSIFRQLAKDMGPETGPCQLIGTRQTTTPLFAAMVNGAASHVVEQDDLHNSSILHPATVVFPPIFALAQAVPSMSGKDFLTAAVAGYECGIRVGEFLGQSHYRVFHMTATAGTVAAAMAAARILNLDPAQSLHALGSAGTQAGGLWEFLRDAADSKQLHTAKAASDGLLAAYTAQKGLTAASSILEGGQGMAAGMLGEGDISHLTDRLGARWALTETSFKFHASCRHTHPAADALLEICTEHDLDYGEIEYIHAYVYQAAWDVLGSVVVPETIHQSKFSMGFVLALIARYRSAGVTDFSEQALKDPQNTALRERVTMIVDSEIDQQYPDKWGARVEVKLRSGELLSAFTDTPKGDPENMLSREELESKVVKLAGFSGVMEQKEMESIIEKSWGLDDVKSVSETFNQVSLS